MIVRISSGSAVVWLRSVLAAVPLMLAACVVPVVPQQGQAPTASVDTGYLRSRVGPPDAEVIAAYIESGASYARRHALTSDEWRIVEQAISDLPELHRRILASRLARLSFIDAPESAGTALTRVIDPESPEPTFEITLRSDALALSLTDFLNRKEAAVFADDGSGVSVRIDAGDGPALDYLLLHEATHVVDRARSLTSLGGALGSGVWAEYRKLDPVLEASPVSRTPYRRAPRAPLASAPAIYGALAQSPFVSLYSTASFGEDLAELVAWRELSEMRNVRLRIEVRDAGGRSLLKLDPLKSPQVQARFRALSPFLEGQLN